MKKKFSWYFAASESELSEVWSKGILTVDANVLLDLYRYHESTRNALIQSLKEFQGRLWLSNQAAEEFFRNRANVIVSSEKSFKQAQDEVEKLKASLESTISQLKGNRIIPEIVADGLLEKIKPALNDALESIASSRSNYPKYLEEDSILHDLSEMFDGAVGSQFPADRIPELKKEAETRKNRKIPPGYMDSDKDLEMQCGDFFLWRQILEKSKNDGKSVIFVTSERKEDWWEKCSGKTIGPRPELLREAYEFTGKRILIYQTDRFLQYSSKRSGSTLDANVVDEIRAVDSLRAEAEHAVESIEHKITNASETLQEGVLLMKLIRPVRNFTASGYFDKQMDTVPAVDVSLESAPEDIGAYKLRAGAGTRFDFNLHVITADRNQLLPVGLYSLRYKATCRGAGIMTVKQLAKATGSVPEVLMKKFIDAGVEVLNEDQEVSSSERQQLLNYLRMLNEKGQA